MVQESQTLPELKVDEQVGEQWWQTVEKIAAESRPGLETVVLSAIITAMHNPDCEYSSVVCVCVCMRVCVCVCVRV